MISVPKAMHPVLAKRDQNAILGKVQKLMQEKGIDAMVVFRPENLYYTSGYYPKISDLPGNVGINLSVVPSEGPARLVVSTLELEGAMHVDVCPCVVDRPNRYDLMIEIEMDADALPAYDASDIHKKWKEKYSGMFVLLGKPGFESEREGLLSRLK